MACLRRICNKLNKNPYIVKLETFHSFYPPLELLLGVDAELLELSDERVELLRRELVEDAAGLALQRLHLSLLAVLLARLRRLGHPVGLPRVVRRVQLNLEIKIQD